MLRTERYAAEWAKGSISIASSSKMTIFLQQRKRKKTRPMHKGKGEDHNEQKKLQVETVNGYLWTLVDGDSGWNILVLHYKLFPNLFMRQDASTLVWYITIEMTCHTWTILGIYWWPNLCLCNSLLSVSSKDVI